MYTNLRVVYRCRHAGTAVYQLFLIFNGILWSDGWPVAVTEISLNTRAHTLLSIIALTCWGGRGKERKMCGREGDTWRVCSRRPPQTWASAYGWIYSSLQSSACRWESLLKPPADFHICPPRGERVGSKNLCSQLSPGNVTKTCNEQTLDDIILRFGWN